MSYLLMINERIPCFLLSLLSTQTPREDLKTSGKNSELKRSLSLSGPRSQKRIHLCGGLCLYLLGRRFLPDRPYLIFVPAYLCMIGKEGKYSSRGKALEVKTVTFVLFWLGAVLLGPRQIPNWFIHFADKNQRDCSIHPCCLLHVPIEYIFSSLL